MFCVSMSTLHFTGNGKLKRWRGEYIFCHFCHTSDGYWRKRHWYIFCWNMETKKNFLKKWIQSSICVCVLNNLPQTSAPLLPRQGWGMGGVCLPASICIRDLSAPNYITVLVHITSVLLRRLSISSLLNVLWFVSWSNLKCMSRTPFR